MGTLSLPGRSDSKSGGKKYVCGGMEIQNDEEIQRKIGRLVMSMTIDTREDVAKEIYYNGFYAQDWQEQFATWQEFMVSPEFEDECDRLRSKFDRCH